VKTLQAAFRCGRLPFRGENLSEDAMTPRDIDAKARLLSDEFGGRAVRSAALRAERMELRGDPDAAHWRAVEARLHEMAPDRGEDGGSPARRLLGRLLFRLRPASPRRGTRTRPDRSAPARAGPARP